MPNGLYRTIVKEWIENFLVGLQNTVSNNFWTHYIILCFDMHFWSLDQRKANQIYTFSIQKMPVENKTKKRKLKFAFTL